MPTNYDIKPIVRAGKRYFLVSNGKTGTEWDFIAEFQYQPDAYLFVKAKKEREEKIQKAKDTSIEKFGEVYKQLAEE